MTDSMVLEKSLPAVDQRKRPCVKIVACAPKGGVGKTTMIRALLVAARQAGLDCIGINMDRQETLHRWARRRFDVRATFPDLVNVEVVQRNIDDFRAVMRNDTSIHDLAVIDTPPGHDAYASAIASLCQLADLIIIPTTPSMDDLFEVIPFGQKVAQGKGVFILNMVNRQTLSLRDARQMLVRAGDLCPVEVGRYDPVAQALARGLTVLDDPSRPNGTADFEAVWEFVRRRVNL